MSEFSFDDMMRTGHVTRWQIVRTARQQTLAEHLYRVWVVTTHLTKVLDISHETASSANIWALMHDLPEVITGDLASPIKQAMRDAIPDDDPVRNIELALSTSYRHAWEDAKRRTNDTEPTAYEIVKLADLIEAKCFIGCEYVGNHAKAVFDEMCGKVEDYANTLSDRYPTLPWAAARGIINSSWNKV